MANALPKNIQAKVKRAVYKKADEFGYMECGRIESGRFLDILVDDPDVGKIIIEYMPLSCQIAKSFLQKIHHSFYISAAFDPQTRTAWFSYYVHFQRISSEHRSLYPDTHR